MRKTAYLLSVAVVALATPAFAQTAPATTQQDAQAGTPAKAPAAAAQTQQDNVGADIVVTATRRADRLSNVPIAVSAVSQASLQNSGGSDIRALNQLAPSLLISSTGSEANASARIRGVGTVGDNPGLESSVAVFIDGVYRSRTGVGLDELGEIDRVEVLRGPQGTLFGRNASAGLINIITRAPEFKFGGNAEATYGNYNEKRLALGLTGPITDTLAARFDGVYVKRDGFYTNVTAAGGSESSVNDRDRYFLRGQLLFKPSADLSFRLIGDYSHRNESCCGATYYSQQQTVDPTANAAQANGSSVNSDGAVSYTAANPIVDILRRAGAVYPLAGTTANPFNREVAVTPGQTYRNTTVDYGVSLQADWNLGGATLTSITAYREYKSGNAGDIDYTNVDITHRAADGNAYRQFHTFTQEARLQGSAFGDKLDWLIGGFYSKEDLRVVDNAVFGSQYGEFAACRLVANISQNAVLQNNTAPGCLSPTGRATVTGAFGAAAPAVLAGLDRLSTINNLGDQGSVYRQGSENYAFFTHNIFHVTNTLTLTAGLRYTHEAKDFSANFNNNNTVCPVQQANLSPLLANPALAPFVGGIVTLSCTGNSSSQLNTLNLQNKFGQGKLTGTAVISWKPIPSLLTYASYAKGYKAGGYNLDRSPLGGAAGVFSPRSNADASALRFDAETVDSYELGAKFKTKGFTLNVAAFRSEFKNFQLNTFNGSVFVVQNLVGCSTSLNGGDTDNLASTGQCTGKADKPGLIAQGVELEATMTPIREFQVTAGYTLADTKIARNLVGNSSGAPLDPSLFLLPGSQLSNAPRNVVTGSVSWTPDIGSRGLQGLVYVDTRLTSDYNTGSDLAPEKKQDGFALVNARIGIRGPKQIWALEFWSQNVFNKQYIQVAFNTPFQGAGSVANTAAFGTTSNALYSAFLGEPRTYGVTLRSRF